MAFSENDGPPYSIAPGQGLFKGKFSTLPKVPLISSNLQNSATINTFLRLKMQNNPF
jgi:hypothetical protein